MPDLPSGRVTLLFADLEGSTRLVQRLGDDGYRAVLAQCRELLRSAVRSGDGIEVDCRADELFAAFRQAGDALAAAVAAQRAFAGHTWPAGASVKVRMGLHTGEPELDGEAYVGLDVNRAARICSAGHGGQVLLSQASRDLLVESAEFKTLGAFLLAGLSAPEPIHQLLGEGLRSEFPPLRVARQERWAGVGRGFLGRRLQERRREPTLVETARRLRIRLPSAEPRLRQQLSGLAAELFAADRIAARADALIGRVDLERLERRLAAQQEMAMYSESAGRSTQLLERQLASVRELQRARAVPGELATELFDRVEQLEAHEIDAIRDGLTLASTELERSLAAAGTTLDPLSFKLGRTRHRGVYTSGGHWVVPYSDELGTDRLREFESVSDAKAYRTTLRVLGKASADYTGPSTRGGELMGGN